MILNDVKNTVSRIMFADKPCGLTVYACIKNESGIIKKEFIIDPKLRESILQVLKSIARKKYLADDIELDSANNIADNRNVLYEIAQNERFHPFEFLNDQSAITAFSENDLDHLTGFAFRINLNSDYFWLYQQVYHMSLIKRSKSIYAMRSKDRTFVLLDRPVLKIEERIDVLVIDKSVITSNIKLLQSGFGFDRYIRLEAKKTIEMIDKLGIVSDTAKIIEFEGKDSLTNAKKLLKAKNSPVLTMKPSDLIAGLKNLPRYKDKFFFEDDKIVINSQKDVGNLIKMLNDSIVRSELTGVEYDSISKNALPPIENTFNGQ